MNTSSINRGPDPVASNAEDLIVRPLTLHAARPGGRSLTVERLNEPIHDELREAGCPAPDVSLPVVIMVDDGPDAEASDVVALAWDDDQPLASIDLAISALQTARRALILAGHVDLVSPRAALSLAEIRKQAAAS